MTTADASIAPETDHALGKLPLKEYDRTHRLQPATDWWGRKLERLTNWIEDVVARFSIHGDPPVYGNEHFPWVEEVEGGLEKGAHGAR